MKKLGTVSGKQRFKLLRVGNEAADAARELVARDFGLVERIAEVVFRDHDGAGLLKRFDRARCDFRALPSVWRTPASNAPPLGRTLRRESETVRNRFLKSGD